MTLPNSRGKSAFWSFLQRSPSFPMPRENDRSVKCRVSWAGGPDICTSVFHLRDRQAPRLQRFPAAGGPTRSPLAVTPSSPRQLRAPAERAGPGATRSPPHPGARPSWWPGPRSHPERCRPRRRLRLRTRRLARRGDANKPTVSAAPSCACANRLLALVRIRGPPPPRPLCAGVDSSHRGSIAHARCSLLREDSTEVKTISFEGKR